MSDSESIVASLHKFTTIFTSLYIYNVTATEMVVMLDFFFRSNAYA